MIRATYGQRGTMDTEKRATVLVIDPLRLKEEINDPKFQGLIADGYHIGTTILRVEGKDDRETTTLALIMEPPFPAPSTPVAQQEQIPAWWLRAVLGLLAMQAGILALIAIAVWLR